jgi:hypothetical protein
VWSKGIVLLLPCAGINFSSILPHACYIIGVGHGIGIGAGIGAGLGIGLVIWADATVANAVNMAAATTTFTIFCAFIIYLRLDLNFFFMKAMPMPITQ